MTSPPNGTIFELLNRYGISWRNYYSDLPSALIWTYLAGEPGISPNLVGIDEFFTDAAAGTLPSFSLVDPNFSMQSEENPQDVQFGDVFLSQVVNAVMASPQWSSTLLVWTYDEGGGYYDHVPPPAAVRPDGVPRPCSPPVTRRVVFNRYGFRVPAGVVSPRAKPDYVSHWSTTTPRSSSWWRRSGTCPPSPAGMRRPTICSTASTSPARPTSCSRPRWPHRRTRRCWTAACRPDRGPSPSGLRHPELTALADRVGGSSPIRVADG